jgi:hypothetical protein
LVEYAGTILDDYGQGKIHLAVAAHTIEAAVELADHTESQLLKSVAAKGISLSLIISPGSSLGLPYTTLRDYKTTGFTDLLPRICALDVRDTTIQDQNMVDNDRGLLQYLMELKREQVSARVTKVARLD